VAEGVHGTVIVPHHRLEAELLGDFSEGGYDLRKMKKTPYRRTIHLLYIRLFITCVFRNSFLLCTCHFCPQILMLLLKKYKSKCSVLIPHIR